MQPFVHYIEEASYTVLGQKDRLGLAPEFPHKFLHAFTVWKMRVHVSIPRPFHIAPAVLFSGDLGLINAFCAPLMLPTVTSRVTQRTDGPLSIPSSAAQQDQPGWIELTCFGKERNSVSEHRTISCFVEQPP